MASADFLQPTPISLQVFYLGSKTSPVKNELFPSTYLPHIQPMIITVALDFGLLRNLIHHEPPHM